MGALEADNELEDITLQQYLDIYRKPLSQPAMRAIKKLTEVAQMQKKKKKEATRKKKNKAAANPSMAVGAMITA
jgi:hypothetical protein